MRTRPTVPATNRGKIGNRYGRLPRDPGLAWPAVSTDLIERWSTAAQAYLDGDLRTYARLAHHTADYTLIPPVHLSTIASTKRS